MTITLLFLALSMLLILGVALAFTNAVEHLGLRLKLSAGETGSVIAAVGTALPETMIAVVALLRGPEAGGHEVGIGAILGAPFMLATVAFPLAGSSALLFSWMGRRPAVLRVERHILQRDLGYFLVACSAAIAASFLPLPWLKGLIAIGLLALYLHYLIQTFRDPTVVEVHLEPLYLQPRSSHPRLTLIVLQIGLALAFLLLGAHWFVVLITDIAQELAVSTLLLALILAPLASELPEKLNSIVWIRDGEDTLALGNLTGAMVFQSSVIVAFGLAFTSWELTPSVLASSVLALISAGLVLVTLRARERLHPGVLLVGGPLYLIYLGYIVSLH